MTLYEINNEILSLIDTETGEIADYDRFIELNADKDVKVENIALYIKNLKALAEDIKEEKQILSQRQAAAESKAERLKFYLQQMLQGSKFESAKVTVSYRKTSSVSIADESALIDWAEHNNDEILTYQQPKINKTKIKELLKAGETIQGAEIKEGISLQIK